MPTALEGLPTLANPMPDVTTDRLELRRFRSEDLDALVPVFAQREVWAYPVGRGFTADETAAFVDRQVEQWETCGVGCWIAIRRETGAVIGYLGLSVPTFLPEVLPVLEVGWRLEPAAWGQGLATEGATAALDEAFSTLGLDGVCSLPQVDNLASVRVAERLGMWRERDVPLPATEQHGSVTAAVFRITAETWPART